jgi:hypothetical protein
MLTGNKMNIMTDVILNNMDEMLVEKIARVRKMGISHLKRWQTVFKVKEPQCIEIARYRQ